MTEAKELKAGDPCPNCGGDLLPDERQDPQRLIDARKRNAANPAVAARYEERVREKVEEFGVIHKCARCGYEARFPTGAPEGDQGDAGGAESQQTPARRRRAS